MNHVFVAIGGVAGFLSVAAGAFGAHALKERLDADLLAVFETGVRYGLAHALALVALGAFADRLPATGVAVAGWSFAVGIAVFSGSLWVLALSGVRWLGAFTPIGGVAFLVGWGALVWAAVRSG